MEVDPKGAAVDVGLVFEGAIRAASAVAWEDSYSKRVPVDVNPEVGVLDARPNEVLEVKVMCSHENSG